ncbi:MAG: CHAT domain-containing protein [Saprospiraceae bacterium]|nr:CHAT domain-containing protein [Saprospiraceae bacterium]
MRGEVDSLRFAGAFGNVRGGIPALMFNKDEVTACAEIFDGKPLTGTTATEAGFVQKAKDYQILHLAMHALTNDSDPLYSQLVFNQNHRDTVEDNLLHAYELYNMRLNADLAVLSACNTGAGKLVRGEGIMSLSRAFKYAGCPNILMSLWSVNDASAKDIIGDFHRKLKDGKRQIGCLAKAQKAIWNRRMKRSHILLLGYVCNGRQQRGDVHSFTLGEVGCWNRNSTCCRDSFWEHELLERFGNFFLTYRQVKGAMNDRIALSNPIVLRKITH